MVVSPQCRDVPANTTGSIPDTGTTGYSTDTGIDEASSPGLTHKSYQIKHQMYFTLWRFLGCFLCFCYFFYSNRESASTQPKKFVRTCSCAQIDLRKARKRELATLDEKTTSSGIAEPYLYAR